VRSEDTINCTVEACKYTRHISDSINVGRVGSRLGSSGRGVSSDDVARVRKSSAWMLYASEWYDVEVEGKCGSFSCREGCFCMLAIFATVFVGKSISW
jgi:NADH:ubiquinone oxidoreductase subunit F (NADH-binding)